VRVYGVSNGGDGFVIELGGEIDAAHFCPHRFAAADYFHP
jgi:hypothetical protein